METTEQKFSTIIEKTRELFLSKLSNYGLSWSVFRVQSVTDIINIKSLRIREIEEKKTQKVEDSIENEYIGIINYCIIAAILLKKIPVEKQNVMKTYDFIVEEVKSLLLAKNHDYGEAWKGMRVSSLTDQIIARVFRIKSLEDNSVETNKQNILENYYDILNYSIFALIKTTL